MISQDTVENHVKNFSHRGKVCSMDFLRHYCQIFYYFDLTIGQVQIHL